MIPGFSHDPGLVEEIATEFDLRAPNRSALATLVERLAADYDPEVPLVLDMATGAGKTYLMIAFIEYLRRQRLTNVMIVTPGLVVQHKTLRNLTPGDAKFIRGAEIPARVITPDNYVSEQQDVLSGRSGDVQHRSTVYVFNIQQLIAPSTLDGPTAGGKEGPRRGIRRYNEFVGVLYDELAALDDLVVIADEHHLYGASAKAFNRAIHDLHPAAVVGLTASADDSDDVIYRYPLYRAIADKYVKSPVIAYRKGGYGELGEHQQLRDAVALLHGKAAAYRQYIAANPGAASVNPLLFVVCADIEHATEIASKLRTEEFFGTSTAVLQVDSDHMTPTTERLLEHLDAPDSPVRAVVSVNKLKEGWDVKNIAVMVTLRAMDSDVLTQQTMGRGLRLPFGAWVDDPAINELDIVAHESFRKLLDAENVLRSFGLADAVAVPGHSTANIIAPAPELQGSGDDTPAGHGGGDPAPTPVEVDDIPDSAPGFDLGGGVRARRLGDDSPDDIAPPTPPERHTVRVDPRFAGKTFLFPRTRLAQRARPFDLTDITDAEIEAAAKTISNQSDRMERVALIADAVERRLRTRSRVQAEVESFRTDRDHVAVTLLRQLVSRDGITQLSTNIDDARARVIPHLMATSGISEWTVKAMASAVAVLADLVAQKTAEFTAGLAIDVEFDPVLLPAEDSFHLDYGRGVVDRSRVESSTDFVPRQYYSDWDRSMYDAESFDSYSGEFKLATLLDTSPGIVWWKRLRQSEDAYVYYTVTRKYFPDFVAEDSDGRCWIIEGKAVTGKSDEIVNAKRLAAESAIRKMTTNKHFAGRPYGYLIAYEDVIASSGSWEDVVARSSPVITRSY